MSRSPVQRAVLGLPVRSPDEIPGRLEPDCLRVLRADYARIQAAMRAPYETVRAERLGRGQWEGVVVGHDIRHVRDEHAVGRAIAEYRRTAALWGVDVEVRRPRFRARDRR